MGNITKEEIKHFLKSRSHIYDRISDLIDYSSDISDKALIDNYFNNEWYVEGDQLYIKDNEEEDEYYSYCISSYSALGEKLFIGESDGITYIMAYNEEDFAEDSFIFILYSKLRESI